jgi:hypothetical protein
MKLVLYEPREVGYVRLNPYEWEYNGDLQSVTDFLRGKPELKNYRAVTAPDGLEGRSSEKLTGEEYLLELRSELQIRHVHECKIVYE